MFIFFYIKNFCIKRIYKISKIYFIIFKIYTFLYYIYNKIIEVVYFRKISFYFYYLYNFILYVSLCKSFSLGRYM